MAGPPQTDENLTLKSGALGPAAVVEAVPTDALTPRLIVLVGAEQGRRFPLWGASATVGRADDCDIQFDDAKVSRHHARLRLNADSGWTIEDLKSRNGTSVNGEALTARRVLEVGDRIMLSPNTLLLYTHQDPLEDLVLHRQQMEVIGQLAGSIAHDFNNLLNVVLANAAHLRELPPDTQLGNQEVDACHADIEAAATQAASLTERLLAIARRDRTEPDVYRPIYVDRLFRETVANLRRSFKGKAKLKTRIESRLRVYGNEAALQKMLVNLCLNARDAMPEGGVVTVSAKVGERMGRQVVLTVQDTGVGMDEATQARVFEPLFTTKHRGTGAGMGLPLVYEVATAHGGSVRVESELGKGSVFTVYLPFLESKASKRPAPAASHRRRRTWDGRKIAKRHGRVLVVDDEQLIRRSIGRILTAAGHDVFFAKDGVDAIEVFESVKPPPDVVLLDLDMPRMRGDECLVRLKKINPDLPVVLLSGYFDEQRRHQLIEAGAIDLLPKPVDAETLRDSVYLGLHLLAAEPDRG